MCVQGRSTRIASTLCCLFVSACLSASLTAAAAAAGGISKIQHVIIVMQENRSFDQYFGTYPGADGIPAGVCLPRPNAPCVPIHHNPNDLNWGGPHGTEGAEEDIDGGRMDGFLRTAAEQGSKCTTTDPKCTCPTDTLCEELAAYHDPREIANYWTYAANYVLQDHMFEPVLGWSLAAHNFLVSGWNAVCSTTNPSPMECLGSTERSPARNWTDVTYLLHKAGVSWRYYLYEGAEPDCINSEALSCEPSRQSPETPGIWNPLASFSDVKEDNQLGNIQSVSQFWRAVHETSGCQLPNVSWIVPDQPVSEHPPALVSKGQAHVTTVINAIMRSPCWSSSAIFVSWDDWGGYYDHVVPPRVDWLGYGLRVPGLMISPYARAGFIDTQQLSHDAYLKFIEDVFLNSARLNPSNDGRPDSRTNVRESLPSLGSLQSEFNFEQAPRQPQLLPVSPHPGPASPEPGQPKPPAIETAAPSAVTATSASLGGTVNPDGLNVAACAFQLGATTSYGKSIPCAVGPGQGTTPVAVAAHASGLTPSTTYHVRLVAANAAGTAVGPDLQFETPAH